MKLSKITSVINTYVSGLKCMIVTLKNGERVKPKKSENRFSRQALIIGNGPSLNEVDIINVVKNKDVFVVNFFATTNKNFSMIKPRYYCLIDPGFYKTEPDERTQKLFEELEKVDWEMTIIAPQKKTIPIKNPNIKMEFITTMVLYANVAESFLNYLHRNNYATCGLQNVIAGAIYYCIIRKYGKVYVCGFDMSEFQVYRINEKNHVLAKYTHYYGDEFIDVTERGSIPIGEFYIWIGKYAEMFKQFHYVSAFAKQQNVEVINLTSKSFVDAFKKEDWHRI